MKISKIFLTLTAAALLSSCNLDYSPTAAISDSNLKEDDYEFLLIGVYDGAQKSGTSGHVYVIGDILADNLNSRGWYVDPDQDNVTAANSDNDWFWEELYSSVQLCNNLITLIQGLDNPTPLQKQYEAESRVIRAWLYTQIIQLWGSAPLLTEVTDDPVPRNTEEELWQFVKSELEYGVANAPELTSISHISNTAAKALLARVLLIAPSPIQDKARAAQLAKELIDDGRFQLADDPAEIWHSRTSSEIILQWNNISGDSGAFGWFLRSNLVDNYNNEFGSGAAGYGELGRYDMPVETSLWNSIEEGDKRMGSTLRHLQYGTSETYDVVKYPSYNGADPYPVARIAEQYLIEAEALGYPAGVEYLNALRVKRGLKALEAGSDITDDNFIWKVMQERRVELLAEGHRWYDLRRWFNSGAKGKADVLSLRKYQPGEAAGSKPYASEVMDIADDGHNLLWPVPAVAIQNDPNLLPQNPGY